MDKLVLMHCNEVIFIQGGEKYHFRYRSFGSVCMCTEQIQHCFNLITAQVELKWKLPVLDIVMFDKKQHLILQIVNFFRKYIQYIKLNSQ